MYRERTRVFRNLQNGAAHEAESPSHRSGNWRQFRLDAQLGGVTESFDWHEANKRAQADFNKGDFEGALKEALAIENANLANLDGHFDAYIAYKHLNRANEMASISGFCLIMDRVWGS